MNPIRERVLMNVNKRYANERYEPLIQFCVGSECFEDWEEAHENGEHFLADFRNVIVVVPEAWMFTYMQEIGIDVPIDYLCNEYTSEDSYEWFMSAASEDMVFCVLFE